MKDLKQSQRRGREEPHRQHRHHHRREVPLGRAVILETEPCEEGALREEKAMKRAMLIRVARYCLLGIGLVWLCVLFVHFMQTPMWRRWCEAFVEKLRPLP